MWAHYQFNVVSSTKFLDLTFSKNKASSSWTNFPSRSLTFTTEYYKFLTLLLTKFLLCWNHLHQDQTTSNHTAAHFLEAPFFSRFSLTSRMNLHLERDHREHKILFHRLQQLLAKDQTNLYKFSTLQLNGTFWDIHRKTRKLKLSFCSHDYLLSMLFYQDT